MLGVNKVILIGNLGKDPELRYTPGGQPTASFSLATTERWNDKAGKRQERTEWHNIVAWGKLAELVNQYLKKGRSAYIEGRINYRSWDDRDGNKKYKTEIVASQIQFLSSGGAPQANAVADSPQGVHESAPRNDGGEDAPPVADQGSIVEENLPF
jgi:single-strand DNA-binding protein